MTTQLEASLPEHLRGPKTTITRVAAGLSGAGVYRVDCAGEEYLLKVARDDEPRENWRQGLHILQLAADAGLAPRIVHTDEARRAIVSRFVADRSFALLYADPARHDAALELLGRTVQRVHELPLSATTEAKDARAFLALMWGGLSAGFPLPAFVSKFVEGVLAEEPPPSGREPVLSHNDINPTNLVYDGERLLLFDWDTAGANDHFYDLAEISLFLRMDGETCRKLLSFYGEAAPGELPPRFLYDRRLAAAMLGTVLLGLARQAGHPGDGDETSDSALSLADFYQRTQAGSLDIATPKGQWAFALALMKEGAGSLQ